MSQVLHKAGQAVETRLREVAFEQHQQDQDDQKLNMAASKLIPDLDRLLNQLIQFNRYEDAVVEADKIVPTLTKEMHWALWMIYLREEKRAQCSCCWLSIFTCGACHCFDACRHALMDDKHDTCAAALVNRKMIIIWRLKNEREYKGRIYW